MEIQLKKNWIRFHTALRITTRFLIHHIKNGCQSWDRTIQQLLAFSALVTLNCRQGDIVEDYLVSDVTLTLGNIRLYFPADATGIKYTDLRALVALRMSKYHQGDSRQRKVPFTVLP